MSVVEEVLLGTTKHLAWHYEGPAPDPSLKGPFRHQKGTKWRLHDHVDSRENSLMLGTVPVNKKHVRSAINEKLIMK